MKTHRHNDTHIKTDRYIDTHSQIDRKIYRYTDTKTHKKKTQRYIY